MPTSPLNGPFESRLPVLVLLETNSKDYNSFEKRLRRDFSKGLLLHNMFWSSQRASNVRHKCKQHRRRLQHRASTYIAKACHHALFHYTVYSHYTATIQPLYSHYTATIQPEEVMSEAWGLYVGAPAERSGESDKWEYTPNVLYNGVPGSTSGSTPNVLYNGSRMVRW